MLSSRNAVIGWVVLRLVRWGIVKRRRSILGLVARFAAVAAALAAAAGAVFWFLRRQGAGPTDAGVDAL